MLGRQTGVSSGEDRHACGVQLADGAAQVALFTICSPMRLLDDQK